MSVLFGDEPQQLIAIDADGRLRTVESTLALIRAIDNPNGLGAIVLAGPYHRVRPWPKITIRLPKLTRRAVNWQGKSYLLNRIAKTDNGFKVGLQTEAETKGLWVLARNMGGLTVLLIDSEGIDAPGNKATIDSRVFALCLLLSSVFVYNTTGLIEENSLRHLSFVTSLAEHIRPSAEEHASVAFPSLLWLVRDFQYWRDIDAKHDGSANAYMESVLSRASSGGADDNDNIREGLSKIFPRENRACYLLPTPALDTENLISLPDEEISKKFVERLSALVEDVLPHMVNAKRQGGSVLRGKGYARLVELLAAAMNEEVEDVTLFIPNIRARFAVSEAEEQYERGVEFDSKKFPMSDEELLASHKSRMQAALKLFDGKAYGPTKDSLETELREKLEKKYANLKRRNSEVRDRAYLGFGQLNTAVVAAVICFIVAAISPIAWTMLMAGTVAVAFYMDQFYTITNNFAMAINMGIALWNEHVKDFADENPAVMVGIIIALTLFLWWFF